MEDDSAIALRGDPLKREGVWILEMKENEKKTGNRK
jgi:hypothetical protein